jgi:predicted amidohydrolase YtcJ
MARCGRERVLRGHILASVDDPGYLAVYQELAHRGELTAHVAAYPVVQPDLGTPQIEVVEALRARFKGVPDLTIPGLKVFADGDAEFPAQTAALTKPYLITGRSTPLMFTPAKMNALVTEAARRGLNVHIHAIGDLAVKASLDAFGVARTAVPQSTLPFSIAHARFVDPEDIPRFAQLRVIAVLQLLWASPEASDSVKPYIDPEIYRWMYSARSILDAGGENRRRERLARQLTQPVARDRCRGDAIHPAGRRARRDTARTARGDALRLHAQRCARNESTR